MSCWTVYFKLNHWLIFSSCVLAVYFQLKFTLKTFLMLCQNTLAVKWFSMKTNLKALLVFMFVLLLTKSTVFLLFVSASCPEIKDSHFSRSSAGSSVTDMKFIQTQTHTHTLHQHKEHSYQNYWQKTVLPPEPLYNKVVKKCYSQIMGKHISHFIFSYDFSVQ